MSLHFLGSEGIIKEKHWSFHPKVSFSTRKRIMFMFAEVAFCLNKLAKIWS